MLKTQARPCQIIIHEYLPYIHTFPGYLKEKIHVPLKIQLLILYLIAAKKKLLSKVMV